MSGAEGAGLLDGFGIGALGRFTDDGQEAVPVAVPVVVPLLVVAGAGPLGDGWPGEQICGFAGESAQQSVVALVWVEALDGDQVGLSCPGPGWFGDGDGAGFDGVGQGGDLGGGHPDVVEQEPGGSATDGHDAVFAAGQQPVEA